MGMKERIKYVFNHRKLTFWIIVAAFAACIILTVSFLTSPVSRLSDRHLINKAYAQANAAAVEHNLSISKDNAEVIRTEDGQRIEVVFLTIGELPQVSVTFRMDGTSVVGVVASVEKKVVGMVDKTVTDDIGTDTALEKFWEDTVNEYYFRSIKSASVFVMMSDGTAVPVVEALQNGIIEINDLTKYNMEYIVEKKTDVVASDINTVPAAVWSDTLDAAISAAIHDHQKLSYPGADYTCTAYLTLSTNIDEVYSHENKNRTDGRMVLFTDFNYVDGRPVVINQMLVPTVMTFQMNQKEEYLLLDYQEAQTTEAVEKLFPGGVVEDALNTQRNIDEMMPVCYAKAIEYGRVDTDAVISDLIDTVCTSPAQSSIPYDYIEAHPTEMQELAYYGEYTLRYVYSQFLKGDQTGLRGYVMQMAMMSIGHGEMNLHYDASGQEYFDYWLTYIQNEAAQYGMEWMKENMPASYLCLEMMEE